ncbi:MAG: ankyrin repeat domain-containing protein [Planctomycetota bacterium]|jgi:cytohesin
MIETRRVIIHIGLVGVVLLAAVAFFTSRPNAEARFIRAVRDGDVNTVSAMLSKNSSLVEVEQHHKVGSEPVLYIALRRDRRQIVRLLLSHGASPKYYPCPLRYAQDPGTVELLIQYGADVNGRDEDNSTPTALHFFAAIGNTELADLVINHGADVNAKDRAGETPLHEAAQEGCLGAAKLLILRGADLNAESREGNTPFDQTAISLWHESAHRFEHARIRKCKEVAAYLLACGSAHTVSDLAWLGDMERTVEMIESDPSLVHERSHGETPLFAAIRGSNAEVVEYLLAHGARLGVTGRYGQTPLHLAAHMGYVEVARVLLGHGADVNERGPWGETALHWAAVRGNTDVAAILLKSRADTDSQTLGQTVDLHVRTRETDPVERELRWFRTRQMQRANPRLQVAFPSRVAFAKGDTPLHAAIYWNHADIVELLIGSGAEMNRANCWGETPLHYAVVCRYYDIAQMLLDHGADSEAKTNKGLTLTEIAREVKDKKLLDLLNERND